MEKIRMWDVVSLLGLPSSPSGGSSYYVPCPCCDKGHRSRDRHLNINLKKEVFRCPRCGISGGIFDLYALFKDIPRNQARKAIEGQLYGRDRKEEPQEVGWEQEVQEYPMADIQTRHVAYSALLSKLSLAADHKENLLARGLTEPALGRLQYKTTPVVGMGVLAKKLGAEGITLAGVPGFYRDGNGAWTFIHEKRGILIPVRDWRGQIQGLQIRRDHVAKRKFRWVSSYGRLDGSRAEGWPHLAGEACPRIILTEGPMKADVIHALTGHTVLAVPGVNALTHLERTLLELREKGVTEIKTAFDMDFSVNPHVQNGYDSLLRLLDRMGFSFGIYLWDPTYKGLDDYVWAMMRK